MDYLNSLKNLYRLNDTKLNELIQTIKNNIFPNNIEQIKAQLNILMKQQTSIKNQIPSSKFNSINNFIIELYSYTNEFRANSVKINSSVNKVYDLSNYHMDTNVINSKNTRNIEIERLSVPRQTKFKSKPKLIITNHGTIAHELASFKIPVLCTGDNPHINYNFCLHAKNLNHIKKILNNLDHETKKINFDKRNIYEYLYMRYEYFFNLYDRKKYLKDDYFLFKNVKKNQTSDVFSHFVKISESKGDKINLYLNSFYKSNF